MAIGNGFVVMAIIEIEEQQVSIVRTTGRYGSRPILIVTWFSSVNRCVERRAEWWAF